VITEIGIEDFKSLEKVHLKLGKFNLFVGANASGKSNFFDALRVLQGIGNGFSIEEIFQGRPKSATSEVWQGIRGGIAKARFMRQAPSAQDSGLINFQVGLKAPRGSHAFFYSVGISPDRGVIESEALTADAKPVFKVTAETTMLSDWWMLRELSQKGRPALPALTSLGFLTLLEGVVEEERKACVRLLANMQRLSPVPDILRDYGQLFLANRIGESGENFASLVKAILSSEENGQAYVSWLRELLSSEAEDIEILSGAVGEPLFALKRGNLVFPAHILSDGTLRFAALVAAFFQPDMPDIITIEEIDNGIHPARLRLLVELLKSQSAESGPQVFATTHSPGVLAWLDEADYETTFFCRRDAETGASIIKPLTEIPHLVELVKKQPLSELFMEGWMEMAS
jgi:predicted ATPase